MEGLSEPFRSVAYIATPDKHLGYGEILAAYKSSEYKEFKG